MTAESEPQQLLCSIRIDRHGHHLILLWRIVLVYCMLATVATIVVYATNSREVVAGETVGIAIEENYSPHLNSSSIFGGLPVNAREPYLFAKIALNQTTSSLTFLPFKLILIWCAIRFYCPASWKQRFLSLLHVSLLSGVCFFIASFYSTGFGSGSRLEDVLVLNFIYWWRYIGYSLILLIALFPMALSKQWRGQYGVRFGTRNLILITIQFAIVVAFFGWSPEVLDEVKLGSLSFLASIESVSVLKSVILLLASLLLVWRLDATKWSIVTTLLFSTAGLLLLDFLGEIVQAVNYHFRLIILYGPFSSPGISLFELRMRYIRQHGYEYWTLTPIRTGAMCIQQVLMIFAIKAFSTAFSRTFEQHSTDQKEAMDL